MDPSQPLMPCCQTRFKAGNRCRSPESQARSPVHMIPFDVLLGLEVEFVWYELEMEIALQTQGQMAKSQLERGTSPGLFSLQTLSVCTAAGTKSCPNFCRQGQPSPGWFHTENDWRATGKLWNLGINRSLRGIDVVLQQSTSGASSSKDVGCLMPHFLFFESWTMCFLEGIFNFFLFCFVFKVFFIRGWTNDVLSCESKPEISANLWSDFFSFQTILLSWNET